MIDPKWDNHSLLISISHEIFSETSIRTENHLCSIVDIVEILVYIFLFDETIPHMEILRILGMECRRIGNMSLLTDICDGQAYGSLGHDMDKIWADISYMSKDIAWKC